MMAGSSSNFFLSAQDPMHNSENQEATANCRNVLSPHSFLSIFRTTMTMVLSIVWIRDYTGSRPRSIWSASDFNTTENQVGLKEQTENKNQFLLSFPGFAWTLAEHRSRLLKIGFQSDFCHFKHWIRWDLRLRNMKMSSPFSEYWRFWGKWGYYFKCFVETIQKEKLKVSADKLILKIHLLRHNSVTMPLFDYYNQLTLKLFQAWLMFCDCILMIKFFFVLSVHL